MPHKKRSIEDNLHLNAKPEIFENAKELRSKQTEAEQLLWDRLRNKQLNGFKFRRQHPLMQFIADFYCHEKKLVVELDGEIHDEAEQSEYDDGRSYELKRYGMKVLRFTNNEVFNDIDKVIEQIREELKERD